MQFGDPEVWDGHDQLTFPNNGKAGSASLVTQMVKNLPAMQETQVWSLVQEDTLEKGMPTCSSILTWRIPWTEEPGRGTIGSKELDTAEQLTLSLFHFASEGVEIYWNQMNLGYHVCNGEEQLWFHNEMASFTLNFVWLLLHLITKGMLPTA